MINLSKKNVWCSLAIAVLISPVFFMHYNVELLTYSYAILETLAIITLLWFSGFKIKIDLYTMTIVGIELMVFFPTLLLNRLSYSYLCMLVGELSLTIFIATNIHKKPHTLVELFNNALLLLYILDVSSICISFVIGTYTNDSYGIVGHKNYHAFLFILCIGFRLINKVFKQENKLNRATIAMVFLSVTLEILVKSASGVVAVSIFAVLILLDSSKKCIFKNLFGFVLVQLVINIVVVFFMTKAKWMQYIFALLGRDSGLTGRSLMWESAIVLINKSPLIGYGFNQPISVWSPTFGSFVNNNCHNFWLNLLLSGGIIYFMAVIFMLFMVIRRIDSLSSEASIRILGYMIGCYLLLGVSEIVVCANTMFLPLLSFGFYSEKFLTNSSCYKDN